MGLHEKMSDQNAEMRDKAFRICRDYLNGAWKQISSEEMALKRISGGLSNWLFLCTLPASHPPKNSEPHQVLLRLYGQIHGERAFEGLITESVIFTLLSERRLGPRLHGIFPGGRIEEYIPARPLKTRELSNSKFSKLIAERMAQIHCMNVPISKEPRWLWDTMARWIQGVQEDACLTEVEPEKSAIAQRLLKCNFKAEIEWLRKYLVSVKSPVVFCHNDMQEGNILLRAGSVPEKDQLVLIDFEYCSYNYRGFDIANHFCEWMYDYTVEEPPNFEENTQRYPSREQQSLLWSISAL